MKYKKLKGFENPLPKEKGLEPFLVPALVLQKGGLVICSY